MEHIVRGIFKCWIRMRNCCRRRPKTTEYKTIWHMLYSDGMFERVDKPKFEKNAVIAFQHVTRTKPSGQVDEKVAIHYREKYSVCLDESELFDPVQPPWLMISCDDEDFTDTLHEYICRGNTITLDLLNLRFGQGKWTYLNPKTFEDVDFPSEGIVIN